VLPRTLVAETPAELERLRPLWESLYQSGARTLFQSFAWNLLAARAFQSRETPRVIAVETESGAAILPACLADRGLSFLGESLFDYRDMLVSGDAAAATVAWREAARSGASFQVTAIRDDARSRWREMGFRDEHFVVAPCVRRADIMAVDFAAQHQRSARVLRRLGRMGVEFRRYSGMATRLVRSIYERKAAQPVAEGVNLFADPARREFLVAAAGMGGCDVFTLESAGALVAALVTFRDGVVRRFYTTYYDHAWAHFSPGIALLFESTRRSLEEGFDCDYMTGDQPHKMRFATSSVPLYRIDATAELLATIAADERLAAA